MECPVCLTDKPLTRLACKHHVCQHCMEKMWNASTDGEYTLSCPLCRRSLYFKNMKSVMSNWIESKHEEIVEGLYNRLIDVVADLYNKSKYRPPLNVAMKSWEDAINHLGNVYWFDNLDIYWDECCNYVLHRDELDYFVLNIFYFVFDLFTFERLLFVSKYSRKNLVKNNLNIPCY